MTLAMAEQIATADNPAFVVVSDAAGRMRIQIEWVRSNP